MASSNLFSICDRNISATTEPSEKKLDEAIKDTYIYVVYIDDTFILCKSEDHANELLELFNSIHPNIKFTMEQENCIYSIHPSQEHLDGSVHTVW